MGQQYDELAYVYARSLFELAEDAGGLEKIGEVLEELEVIVELSRSDSDFREFLSSPIIGLGPRQKALKSIFDGRISDLVLRFLLVTNSKGRLGHIDQITGALGALVQEAHGRIEVDVITASGGEASPELLEAVRSRVQSVLGKEPVLHHYSDPTMIGGIKMRIGDQLVDGSVATRLRRMKEEILGKGATQVRSESERFLEGAS
jgi:F-type H+-transporting ATPase subunit delta